MITNNKGRSGGDRPTPNILNTVDFIQIAAVMGWRERMALGNGQFRINGTYNAIAPQRTMRRKIQRAMKKKGGLK